MKIEKENILSYLADLRSYYATYHNHKETSAWAAIAFCILLAGPVATTLAAVTDCSLPLRVIATALLVGVFIVTCAYLNQQFQLRRDAANVVEACDYWATRTLTMENDEIKATDFVPATGDDERTQGPHTLPNCIQSKADSLGHNRRHWR